MEVESGGPGRIRTSDTWYRKPVLYPLSYGPAQCGLSRLSMVTQPEALFNARRAIERAAGVRAPRFEKAPANG